MGDWWIDESTPTGPYQDDGFIEIISGLINSLGLAFQPFFILGRQYGKLFASIDPADYGLTGGGYTRGAPLYYVIPDEYKSERQKVSDAFAKTDKALKVPRGTTEKLTKQFGEISERERKRQIGRGNVSGHGPRARTTFNHNGKRRY